MGGGERERAEVNLRFVNLALQKRGSMQHTFRRVALWKEREDQEKRKVDPKESTKREREREREGEKERDGTFHGHPGPPGPRPEVRCGPPSKQEGALSDHAGAAAKSSGSALSFCRQKLAKRGRSAVVGRGRWQIVFGRQCAGGW